tara:strand:- start:5843 stop:6640 length:798 start_codon:yes stop_codon:yes gene_type:complete
MNHYLKTGVIAFALTLVSIFSVSADELDRLEAKLKSEEVAKTEPAFVVSANVGIASEYVWRGVTQSNEDPALQGGFDISHSTGFYVGTWASSLETNSGKTDAASTEIDVYAGYRGQVGSMSYDVGYLHYIYPETNEDSSADFGFGEIYGSFSKALDGFPLSPVVQVGVNVSPDFYGEDGLGVYVYKSVSAGLPFGITGNVTSGYQDVEGDKTTPAGYDYWHYSVGASKDIGGLTATLAWHDVGTENYCSSSANCEAVVFSISASF